MCNFTFRSDNIGIEKDRHTKGRRANGVHRIEGSSVEDK